MRKVENTVFAALWGGAVYGGFAAAVAGLGPLIIPITLAPVLVGGLYRRAYRQSRQKTGYLPENSPAKRLASPLGRLGEASLGEPNDGSS